MPTVSERLRKLLSMLEREPRDAFVLYGIAMEYKKSGDVVLSLDYLKRVIEADARNAAAWQQTGILHEDAGNIPAAREAFRSGIDVARLNGDRHAADEMQGSLDMLE